MIITGNNIIDILESGAKYVQFTLIPVGSTPLYTNEEMHLVHTCTYIYLHTIKYKVELGFGLSVGRGKKNLFGKRKTVFVVLLIY